MELPRWNRIKATHHRGMLVEGVVRHVSEHGATVQLHHKSRPTGFIHGSEIRAAVRNNHLSQEDGLAPGAIVKAAVHDYDRKRFLLLLTLKPLYRTEVDARFAALSLGDVVTGNVAGHRRTAVFVSLDNGGDAYLSVEELDLPSSFADRDIEDILHIGDRIKAKIVRKNEEKQKIGISVRELRAEVAANATQEDSDNQEELGNQAPDPSAGAEAHPIPQSDCPRHLLVMENDSSTRALFAETLREAGHTVEEAPTLSEAMDKIRTDDFDCVLADIRMDMEKRSTDVILDACSESSGLKALFVSGKYLAADVGMILEGRATVLDAIYKPVDWEKLFQLLDDFEPPEEFEIESYSAAQEGAEMERRFSPADDEDTVISALFKKVCDHFSGAGVAVLRRKKLSHDFSPIREKAMDESGLSRLFREAKYDWFYSPLGDLVVEGKSISYAGLSKQRPGRFKPFLETGACDFHSILGAPVLIQDIPTHGIIVVATGGQKFEDEDHDFLASMADLLSMRLESARALDLVAHQHTRVSASDLLIHDIGGQVQDLEDSVRAKRALRSGDIEGAKEFLDRGIEAYRALQDTTKFFRDIARHAAADRKTVGEILGGMEPFFQRRCERSGIVILFPENGNPALVHRYPEATLRQLLNNLLLNAYIHVKQFRRNGERWIAVEVSIEESDTERPLKIRVRDTACGVHEDEKARIFEPYFTTREDGMGLGLHICQRLARALRATVEVEETYLYCGSTFVVSLPTGT